MDCWAELTQFATPCYHRTGHPGVPQQRGPSARRGSGLGAGKKALDTLPLVSGDCLVVTGGAYRRKL